MTKDFQSYQELRAANWSKLFNYGNPYQAIHNLVKSEMSEEDQLLVNQCATIIQKESLKAYELLKNILEIIDSKNSLFEVR